MQIAVKFSDVRLHLTKVQYGLLIQLSQAVPRIFVDMSEVEYVTPPNANTTPRDERLLVDLEPEVVPSTDKDRVWPTFDLIVSINAVKLHLYDAIAFTEGNLKDHGVVRLALNDNTLRLKILSDGAGEAQVVLRSLTMSNTRPGGTKFREMIPAAQHERNQFMMLYTMSGGAGRTSLAVLTVDSPQIIFAVDPVIALLEFFTTPVTNRPPFEDDLVKIGQSKPLAEGRVDFRIDLHDLSVGVLEDDADPESHYIKLSVDQILLSQQVGLSYRQWLLLTGIYRVSWR